MIKFYYLNWVLKYNDFGALDFLETHTRAEYECKKEAIVAWYDNGVRNCFKLMLIHFRTILWSL